MRSRPMWIGSSVFALLAAAPLAAQEQAQPEAKVPTARSLIADAVARAAKKNRRVLLEFRADGCERSAALDLAWKKDRQLAHEMLYEYVLVQVDGAAEAGLSTGYGLALADTGTPALAVLDGKGKSLLALAPERFFGDAGLDAAKLLGLLAEQRAAPQDAEKLLAAACADATKSERRVFVHFDAPW